MVETGQMKRLNTKYERFGGYEMLCVAMMCEGKRIHCAD